MFPAMDACARWIREKSATSLNPSQVQTSLVQLSEQWPASAQSLIEVVEQFPTGELSQIAEICIRRVFNHWDTELRHRHGSPRADFAILALGKLGGAELNHSSDVDLLFLYSEEGQLAPHISYHEFFNRLGNKILERS